MHRFLKRIILVVAVLAIASPAAWAGQPARWHDIEPEDYFSLEVITECAVSPDGEHVAYAVLGWRDDDQPRSTDLWVVETKTKEIRRLTFDPANDSGPQWGADSRYIYFTTSRERAGEERPPYDGSHQVYRVSVDGGEPFPVTRVKDGISGFQLSEDGRTLYYTKSVEQEEDEWKDLRGKYGELEYGHGTLHSSELWTLDLATWREKKLVAEDRFIRYFAVSRDKRRIAMITVADDRLITHEGWSRMDVYDVETEDITTLEDKLWRADAPSPHGWLGNPVWSSDGGKLAWTVDYDGYPSEVLVARWTGNGPTVSMMKRLDEVSVTGGLEWKPGTSDLFFLGEQRARQRILGIDAERDVKTSFITDVTPGDVVVHAYSFSGNGELLAYVMSDTTQAGDLFLLSSSAPREPVRLTQINPQVDTWKLPQISIVKWQGANGDEVQGILELPPDYKEGEGPLPLIAEIHGGPTACTYLRLRFWIYGRTLMAAKGYALLSPNYRGSTGYGDKFLTDLIGHENNWDVKDILTGVDAMVERGIADPDRLGVMGWSNGGLLTNCVITTTTRFKAASTGAGTVDQLMQWGLEDTPGHVVNYMQGLPWDATEAYIKGSAIYKLGKVTTPTLIHVGAKDPRVPPEHCYTLYRGLKDYLDVPTELLVYPGAGHGLTVRSHRKAKMEWDLAWFEKYILGQESDEPDKP
ncbi:MAG TPA: prolyl oligopeptidase family serine peptidase [Phycisphaerae bacterium]|nr:prolyl oligopeptidase family serine peptidase [Phycisphaerae bacterium]